MVSDTLSSMHSSVAADLKLLAKPVRQKWDVIRADGMQEAPRDRTASASHTPRDQGDRDAQL